MTPPVAPKRYMHVDRLHHLIDKALALGGQRVNLFRTRWNIAGNCSRPYERELHGRPQRNEGERYTLVTPRRGSIPQVLELHTRCRRCENCLRTRRRRWAGAAIMETRMATRTWFGTLTFEPAELFRAKALTIKRLAEGGTIFDRLSPDEQYVERLKETGAEVTRYLKRVRKNSNAQFRYLLVAEAHKSGEPHYHMLLHENAVGGMVRHRHLSEAWHVGFEKWRLSDPHDPNGSAYLCKYLSKTLLARVRASQRYGGASSDYHSNVLKALMGVVERRNGGESPGLPVHDPLYAF